VSAAPGSPELRAAPPPGLSPRLAWGALAALAGLRVAYWLLAPPNADEAYYWLWGRHPALSYLDHPPLHAWLQGLAHATLGTSALALRLGPALSTLGTGWLLWRLARRLAPDDAGAGPRALALAFASPLLAMLTAFAWNDHLLLLGWLLSSWLSLEFLDEVQRGKRGRTTLLLGAGLALGLAGLSKYSALFLGGAVAVVITRDRRLRHLWRDPRLWLAAALALLVISPVLLWNGAHGGASFRFHLVERVARGGQVGLMPLGPVRFLLPLAVAVGPLLAWAALPPAVTPAPGSYAALNRSLALAALLLPTGFFAALSLLAPALYYWDVVGWLLLVPAAAVGGRPRLQRGHLAFGLLAVALMTAHATLLPLTAFTPAVQDDDSRMTWGWDEVAAAVRQAQADRPGAFLAASDYRSGASLAFALDEAEVKVLSRRHSQFEGWLAAPTLAGRDALLVVEAREPMEPWLAGHFAAVRRLRTVEARRLGLEVKRYELWLGERFGGAP